MGWRRSGTKGDARHSDACCGRGATQTCKFQRVHVHIHLEVWGGKGFPRDCPDASAALHRDRRRNGWLSSSVDCLLGRSDGLRRRSEADC
jgi:hypothetical protein